MNLYRYFSSHVFETLQTKRLMLAMPSTLNDPFEFLYKNAGQITMAKARKYIRDREKSESFYAEMKRQYPAIRNKSIFKRFMRENRDKLVQRYFDSYEEITEVRPEFCNRLGDNNFRISCFSSTKVKPHEEILMWSHYASKHTGIRIKFDLDETQKYPYFIKEVKYSKERIGLDLTSGVDNEHARTTLINAITTKAEGWAYEREYRLFALPSLCIQEVGSDRIIRSFLNFDPDLIIGVDFGLNCPQAEIDRISNLAGSIYPKARLRRAFHHKSDFAIEYKDI